MAKLLFTREIKELESKSQRTIQVTKFILSCYLPVKLKNLKANHNTPIVGVLVAGVVIYP